jgi:uncharacterized protein (TIGR02246 family)
LFWHYGYFSKGGYAMRIAYMLCFFLALSIPAVAAETDQKLKQEMENAVAAYATTFNKLDPAGMAALYASDGVLVNTGGLHTDLVKWYEGVFKAGINHLENTLDQFWPLGPDTALSMGEYRSTGKNQSGAAIENAGRWTAVDVREGGVWKIRMLTAFLKPPPPQAAK